MQIGQLQKLGRKQPLKYEGMLNREGHCQEHLIYAKFSTMKIGQNSEYDLRKNDQCKVYLLVLQRKPQYILENKLHSKFMRKHQVESYTYCATNHPLMHLKKAKRTIPPRYEKR